jgi:hypothetical protein
MTFMCDDDEVFSRRALNIILIFELMATAEAEEEGAISGECSSDSLNR